MTPLKTIDITFPLDDTKSLGGKQEKHELYIKSAAFRQNKTPGIECST